MPEQAATPESIMGVTLRTLRMKRGLSQDQVADRMRVAGFSWQQTTVAKTEGGQRPIRVNEAVALARMFDVTVSYLLTPRREDEHQIRIAEARRSLERAQYGVAEARVQLTRSMHVRLEAEEALAEAIRLAEEAGVFDEAELAAVKKLSDDEPPS